MRVDVRGLFGDGVDAGKARTFFEPRAKLRELLGRADGVGFDAAVAQIADVAAEAETFGFGRCAKKRKPTPCTRPVTKKRDAFFALSTSLEIVAKERRDVRLGREWVSWSKLWSGLELRGRRERISINMRAMWQGRIVGGCGAMLLGAGASAGAGAAADDAASGARCEAAGEYAGGGRAAVAAAGSKSFENLWRRKIEFASVRPTFAAKKTIRISEYDQDGDDHRGIFAGVGSDADAGRARGE